MDEACRCRPGRSGVTAIRWSGANERAVQELVGRDCFYAYGSVEQAENLGATAGLYSAADGGWLWVGTGDWIVVDGADVFVCRAEELADGGEDGETVWSFSS